MRYIKLFEAWSDNTDNDTISTLKDICLELEDKGFVIEFDYHYNKNTMLHTGIIIIARPQADVTDEDGIKYDWLNTFNLNEVMEVIDRIKDYLGDRWLGYGSDEDIHDSIDYINSEEVAEVQIAFLNN